MGGPSHEAEVSRHSARAVYDALSSLGYDVTLIEYEPTHVLEQLREEKIDTVFIAMHGKYGEDGTVQTLLEMERIPYTGCGVTTSALLMDKIFSSRVFKEVGLRMAFSMPLYFKDGIENAIREIKENFSFPVVLKPAREGSTIGIEIVKEENELTAALERAFKVEPRLLTETYLGGEEFTVSVLDGKALPVIQICPHSGQYDYHSKYTKGATDYLVPAPISKELSDEMSRMAEDGYRAAECCGGVRFDFRTDINGVPHVLEANTIPGLTATSLFPKAAAAAGLDFPHFCEKILLEAGLDKV